MSSSDFVVLPVSVSVPTGKVVVINKQNSFEPISASTAKMPLERYISIGSALNHLAAARSGLVLARVINPDTKEGDPLVASQSTLGYLEKSQGSEGIIAVSRSGVLGPAERESSFVEVELI